MTRARDEEIRAWLLRWLIERESDVLPRVAAIAGQCPLTSDHYTIDQNLRQLVKHGLIVRRTGTRLQNRGHAAIRIVATGRVLKTSGCPFEAPDA